MTTRRGTSSFRPRRRGRRRGERSPRPRTVTREEP